MKLKGDEFTLVRLKDNLVFKGSFFEGFNVKTRKIYNKTLKVGNGVRVGQSDISYWQTTEIIAIAKKSEKEYFFTTLNSEYKLLVAE